LFSFRNNSGYFRIVRRARRWYVEYDGLLAGTYDSAHAAARAVAEGQTGFGARPLPPGDIAAWHRGDLC
jgi:hypothetical protein